MSNTVSVSPPDTYPDQMIVRDDEYGPDDDSRLRQIRSRFDIHRTFWSWIHAPAIEDDSFVGGEQWPEDIRKEREEEGRPVLTYNLLPSFVRQITNRVRQDRPTVKVVPVETDRGKSPQVPNLSGTKDYSMADVYQGVIKNIEHVSRADQAYDTAVKHAVDHGFGFFYVMSEWSRADPFVQQLTINRVKNSYSVYLDPDAQEADYRDAQDGFMFTKMNKKTFKEKWPDASSTEFAQQSATGMYDGWYNPDEVTVAQYFWIEYIDDEVIKLSNGMTKYLRDVEPILDELEREEGIHIIEDEGTPMKKKVKRPVCMWQKMTAHDVLEGPIELPFSAIPILIVTGDEMIVDGRIRYESAIRHAKDSQRSYNYWRTAATESVALAPKAPWIGTEAQFKGHEIEYENANNKNLPYLTYNHKDGVPPPQRAAPAQIAAAELQNAIQDGTDMQTIIGLHDASLGREGNEKSGRAITARVAQGATSTYQFPDNLNRALEQMGRLLVEAIPKIYDTDRILRIRMPDDTEDFVEINRTVRDEQTGKDILLYDVAYGIYDVVMDTGPNYETQRQEASDLQMELLKVLGPDRAANIVHLIVKNLGVPGADEVYKILRKMLPDELKTEDEKAADLPRGVVFDDHGNPIVEETGEPYQPPPTPEQQLIQKQQQIEEAKVQAEMAKAKADEATAGADIKQAEAKVAAANATLAKAQSDMYMLQQPAEKPDDRVDMGEIERVIKETMSDHEMNPDAHKSATAEQVADAVVEALGRTKSYVDSAVSKAEKNAEKAVKSNVVPMKPKPLALKFEYDANGNVSRAIPIYEGHGIGLND